MSRARNLVVLAALAFLAGPAVARAFMHAALGDLVRDRELPTIDGGTAPLLGRARASVFVFFRPAQDRSAQVLRQLAALEQELADRPVRFVAIASSTHDQAAVRDAVRDAGLRMPVLVDRDDALYGELGVKMHPTVAVTDAAHRLAAYQPYRRINMLDALRAEIRGVLGELSADEVARAVMPPRVEIGSAEGAARSRLAMARMLLARGDVARAVENARAGRDLAPRLGEAHAVLARALAAAGRCDEARAEVAAAAGLAPGAAAPELPGCAPPSTEIAQPAGAPAATPAPTGHDTPVPPSPQ